jgi:high-affinity Fe2+/Pb2+ permease
LFTIASTKDSSSNLIALSGSMLGLAIAIVFLPFGVSISKEKASTSSGCFNLMISVFFYSKSMPM